MSEGRCGIDRLTQLQSKKNSSCMPFLADDSRKFRNSSSQATDDRLEAMWIYSYYSRTAVLETSSQNYSCTSDCNYKHLFATCHCSRVATKATIGRHPNVKRVYCPSYGLQIKRAASPQLDCYWARYCYDCQSKRPAAVQTTFVWKQLEMSLGKNSWWRKWSASTKIERANPLNRFYAKKSLLGSNTHPLHFTYSWK